MREAAVLSPQNTNVKEAFENIQSDDAIHPLLRSCRSLIDEKSEEAGKKAVSYLARSSEVPADVARACLQLLLRDRKRPPLGLVDQIVTGLMRECIGAKAFLAQRLSQSATVVFEEFYELGDGSANALATVVLDVTAWSQNATQEIAESDVFQLFLAKLMEVGHDHDGKALKGISRLLASDAEKLYSLIDQDTFDAILSSLDNRLPIEIRTQATMATAKYLEASQADGQKLLLNFMQVRFARQKNEDLILAFSAAAAVFPLVPSTASTFFLIEGFVSSLAPLLQKKFKSERVEQAALEMLSAACLDGACRQSIEKHCTEWLQGLLENGKERSAGLAAVILAKLQGPKEQSTNGQKVKKGDHDIVQKLKQMMISPTPTVRDASIEGLAYASSQAKVKQELILDTKFLEVLIQRLSTDSRTSTETPRKFTATFGVLTVLDNLTRYLPTLSEEQKKLSQLKAYANASRSAAEPSPLDQEAAVTKRCGVITTETSLIPVLTRAYKSFSTKSTALMLSILLSLSRNPQSRGKLTQQGTAKLLLQTYTSIAGTTASDQLSRYTASHALARLLISTEPALIFPPSGSPPLISTIRPLITLLAPTPETTFTTSSAQRDLLPLFESLLALTNLASTPDTQVAEQITRLASREIEDLLLSNNTRISRAATELCCNLTSSPAGIALFANPTSGAKRRTHILLALADAEDVPTRRAAGGAIAGVVSSRGGVINVVDREGGAARLVALVEDEDQDCVHRGLMAIGCVAGWEVGASGLKKVNALARTRKVVDGLKGGLRDLGDEVVDELGLRANGG